ncbi:MAG: hypothetical protein JSU83_07130 [Deltaproteobacteria bacterium]|jgi:hypothetical protein|nr:MAG: hypothetical protein JSU83_07130 [Deltaproteobacteria bacterium]
MAKENDVVLIYFEDKPLSFARIEDILPDAKPNWYHVKLLLLQVPLQIVTWILRDAYINGEEFTMHGKRMRLESVVAPETQEEPPSAIRENKALKDTDKAKVISLEDRKKP